MMKPVGPMFVALLVAGCQTTPEMAEVVPPTCVPLQTGAEFSCWWSAPDAPISHCILLSEDEPRCGLKRRAGDFFNRGAMLSFDASIRPNGTWFIARVYEDQEGRVGLLSTDIHGVDFLRIHSGSPVPTGATKPPVWPRFPSGVEFGPEQVRHQLDNQSGI